MSLCNSTAGDGPTAPGQKVAREVQERGWDGENLPEVTVKGGTCRGIPAGGSRRESRQTSGIYHSSEARVPTPFRPCRSVGTATKLSRGPGAPSRLEKAMQC